MNGARSSRSPQIVDPCVVGALKVPGVAAPVRDRCTSMAADVRVHLQPAVLAAHDQQGLAEQVRCPVIAGRRSLLDATDADPLLAEQLVDFEGQELRRGVEAGRHPPGPFVRPVETGAQRLADALHGLPSRCVSDRPHVHLSRRARQSPPDGVPKSDSTRRPGRSRPPGPADRGDSAGRSCPGGRPRRCAGRFALLPPEANDNTAARLASSAAYAPGARSAGIRRRGRHPVGRAEELPGIRLHRPGDEVPGRARLRHGAVAAAFTGKAPRTLSFPGVTRRSGAWTPGWTTQPGSP